MSDVVLGVDVGGTAIKVGAFNKEGVLLASDSFPTPAIVDDKAYTIVCDGLELLVNTIDGDNRVVAIGLDVPGPVTSEGKLFITSNSSINLEGLKEALANRFSGVSIAVLNDANAATLGEMWQGGGKGYSNFVMITLGTGVGGGVVVDGRVLSGAHGCAGEVGHMTINPSEEAQCGCGRYGCLEQYASAKGIVRLYNQICEENDYEGVTPKHISDSKTVFDAASAGDACALEAIDVMCEYLGYAMSIVSITINPQAYVFGGGVAAGFEDFKEPLRKYFDKYTFSGCLDTKFSVATLGNSAGMYGSALEAIRTLN